MQYKKILAYAMIVGLALPLSFVNAGETGNGKEIRLTNNVTVKCEQTIDQESKTYCYDAQTFGVFRISNLLKNQNNNPAVMNIIGRCIETYDEPVGGRDYALAMQCVIANFKHHKISVPEDHFLN